MRRNVPASLVMTMRMLRDFDLATRYDVLMDIPAVRVGNVNYHVAYVVMLLRVYLGRLNLCVVEHRHILTVLLAVRVLTRTPTIV